MSAAEIPALSHYCWQPVPSVYSLKQTAFADDKPKGLWVSVDDGAEGWADWCRSEDFRIQSLAVEHDVVLRPDARILLISTAAALDDFTDRYIAREEPALVFRSGRNIRWAAVAERYQGIVIAPYRWERRLEDGCLWYYGWDCASGCIWDADAIASITVRRALVPSEVAA